MSRSWNHQAHRMEEEDRYYRVDGQVRPWPCAVPKCDTQRSVFVSYDYVTGRAGRVSFAQRGYCEMHAERFAKKHEIEIEDPRAREKHAAEVAFSQVTGKDES